VFDQRPWFVNGLNFAIMCWVPFFDPYHSIITRVDQRIWIPIRPLELWFRVPKRIAPSCGKHC